MIDISEVEAGTAAHISLAFTSCVHDRHHQQLVSQLCLAAKQGFLQQYEPTGGDIIRNGNTQAVLDRTSAQMAWHRRPCH